MYCKIFHQNAWFSNFWWLVKILCLTPVVPTLDSATHVPVVQTLDSTIHWIKVYPMDNAIGFPNTYPLDSDLSGG